MGKRFQLSLIKTITYVSSFLQLFWGPGVATIKLSMFDLQKGITVAEENAEVSSAGLYAGLAEQDLLGPFDW